MAGRRDKVKEGMDSVIPEARVTLDTGLFSENIVVLPLKVANNFLEAGKDVN
jgi:hypothetical protein